MLGHKTLRCINTTTSSEEMNQGETLSLVTNCLNKLCSTLVQLVYTLAVLKIILLYVQSCEKRKAKHIITDQSQNRTRILFFIKLDRYLSVEMLSSSYRAPGLEQLLSLIDSQLLRFNEQHFFSLNLGQTSTSSTLDLETQFLEVLNISQIYQNTSKVRFVKG